MKAKKTLVLTALLIVVIICLTSCDRVVDEIKNKIDMLKLYSEVLPDDPVDLYEEVVFSESIEVLNIEKENLKCSETRGHYAIVDIAKNDKYVIEARLTPETATNKKINYEAIPSVEGLATIDENGVVTFHDVGKVGFVTVTMTPADGGDFTAKLTILVTNTGTNG